MGSSCTKHRVWLFALLVAWIWAFAALTRQAVLDDEDGAVNIAYSSPNTIGSIGGDGGGEIGGGSPKDETIRVIGAEWSTLSEFYQKQILTHMPLLGQIYHVPAMDILSDMEGIVLQMMDLQDNTTMRQDCSSIDLLSLRGKYEIGIFEDDELKDVYCALATTSSDFPWGTVVVHPPNVNDNDNGSSPIRKNLSIDSPHPIHDQNTGEQSIAVFQGTNARSLLIAGSYRYASNETSCQGGSFHISDAAHSQQHGFHAAATAIWKHYHGGDQNEQGQQQRQSSAIDFMAIQFHGMGASTCKGVDAYLTHGSGTSLPTEHRLLLLSKKISTAFSQIRNEMLILTPPAPLVDDQRSTSSNSSLTCTMSGSTNVQGRLWNGVPLHEVCTTAASSVSGRFFHLEQKAWLRDAQHFPVWIEVMNQAFHEFFPKVPHPLRR